MTGRRSLIDRLVLIVAKGHARHQFARFMASTRSVAAVQERKLLEKTRRNADSDYGCDHDFAHIRCYADFTKRVPVQTYDDLSGYIERVKRGDTQAMFGANQRVHMFALTSGTTDQPKFVPVTDAFLSEFRQGWNAFGGNALTDHPGALLRPIVQVVSRMDESKTEAGIPCGAITGLMAATQKRLVRKYYVVPQCVAYIEDAAARYYAIMRLGIVHDPGFLITANPATQLKLARTAQDNGEQLCRDVRDGTLQPELPIDARIRRELAPHLTPDPQCAARLDQLRSRHGALYPKDFWNVGFLANWTGGTMGLHLRDFPKYFGSTPVRDVGLLASEGRMSIPIQDGTAAGVLEVNTNFFEFVPANEEPKRSANVLRAHELAEGQEYWILLTTSAGFYRYDIGDVVRVVGFHEQAPVIEFLHKGAHLSSLAGEKLTERQAVLAMERLCKRADLSLRHFVLAPQWDNPPYYLLHVGGDAVPEQWSTGRLANMYDAELASVNIEYESKRKSARMAPVQLNLLPDGFLAEHDRRASLRRGASNEQFKHRFLLSTPGQDDDFPRMRGGPEVASRQHAEAE